MIAAARSTRARTAVVLHGALEKGAGPDEKDVLVAAAAVEAALFDLGYSATTVALDLDLEATRRRLAAIRPAFVFNLVEAVRGQGRLIYLATALLDAMGLPYTGCRTEAMFLTSHKPLAKERMRAHSIATPDWLSPPAGSARLPDFDGPYIVKSVWEDASIGLDSGAVVDDPRKIAEVLRRKRRQFGGEWFVERYIDGREFNMSVLAGPDGPQVLPAAEMCFIDYPPEKPRIVDYAAKWHADSFEYRNTRRRFDLGAADGPLAERLAAISTRCWEVFGLDGYARVDFRVRADGEPLVLEINANPCLADDAGLIASANRAGLSFNAAVERIINATGAKRLEPPARGRQAVATLAAAS